jgi:hypothetical protein
MPHAQINNIDVRNFGKLLLCFRCTAMPDPTNPVSVVDL